MFPIRSTYAGSADEFGGYTSRPRVAPEAR